MTESADIRIVVWDRPTQRVMHIKRNVAHPLLTVAVLIFDPVAALRALIHVRTDKDRPMSPLESEPQAQRGGIAH